MRGYKILQTDGKWYFQLIPHNSKTQEVGNSKLFDSYNNCIAGVHQFRELVNKNNINTVASPLVKIVESDRDAYVEYCIDGEVLFRSRKYSSSSPKTLCKKCVESIYEHIDDYTLKQVF